MSLRSTPKLPVSRHSSDDVRQDSSTVYRAPTWSWLSIDGAINILSSYADKTTYFADILDVKMDFETHDTTVSILSGFLYLRGILRRVRLSLLKNGSYDMILDDGSISQRGFADVHHSDLAERSNRKEIYQMRLYDERYISKGGPEPCRYTHRVLLLDCVEQSFGMFERIGYGEVNVANEEEGVPRIELKHEADGHLLPCLEYGTSSGLHTIIIK